MPLFEESMSWKKLAVHSNWVSGAKITESLNTDDNLYRRFTATIRGYGNWKIAEGYVYNRVLGPIVIEKVRFIRDRIEAGDDTMFTEENTFDVVLS